MSCSAPQWAGTSTGPDCCKELGGLCCCSTLSYLGEFFSKIAVDTSEPTKRFLRCQKFSSVIHSRETEKCFAWIKEELHPPLRSNHFDRESKKIIKIILRQPSGMESFSLNIEHLAVRNPTGAQALGGKQWAASDRGSTVTQVSKRAWLQS